MLKPTSRSWRKYRLDGRSGRAGSGSADKRAVRMADGALLNRYWDDNDTPRPESGLTTSKPPKATRIVRQPRSIATCAPPPPAGISAPLDGQSAAARHHSHHLDCPGRSQCPDVPSGENLARASKASGTALALRSTMRWLTPASRPSRNTCGMIKRMVRRLRSETHKVRNQLTAAALFPLYVNAASRERATSGRRRRVAPA